jgi:hypothetical protein
MVGAAGFMRLLSLGERLTGAPELMELVDESVAGIV